MGVVWLGLRGGVKWGYLIGYWEKEEPKKPDLFQVKKVGGYEHIPFRSPKYRIVLELLVPMVAVQGNALQELIEIKKEH